MIERTTKTALNHEEILNHFEIIPNVNPFIGQDSWNETYISSR